MGIILEKSKLVFDELIGPNSFDEIFKTVFVIIMRMGLNPMISF